MAPPAPTATPSSAEPATPGEPAELQAAEAAQAAEEAERVYRSYIRAWNDIDFRDPMSWTHLELTSEDMQVTDSTFLTLAHAHELTMSGEIVVERFDVLSTRSEGDVIATACLDVSTVAFQDATGTSVHLDDAPDAQQAELRFVQERGVLVLDAAIVTTVERC